MGDRKVTQQQIDALRLAQIANWLPRKGGHEPNQIADGEACAMEMVAYIAGEPLSDQPECACPVLSSFVRSWNDGLPSDADRERLLKSLIPRLVGTKSTPAIEERRSYMALDWLIRVHTPTWLDRVESLKPHASALRNHEEIADMAGAVAAGEKIRAAWAAAGAAARAAAWDAAGDAARAAAWDAAGDAARAAAWDAAWDAAGAAARAAAGDAARAAAWDAAGDAAGAAAWAALKPTVAELQISASALIDRMIAVES
jgi:hypothetical protein